MSSAQVRAFARYLAAQHRDTLWSSSRSLRGRQLGRTERRKISPQANLSGFRWALPHDPKTVLEQICDALNAGDYEAMRKVTLESLGSAGAAAEFDQHMVVERNRAWLQSLEGYLNEGHAVIDVGAMHLPGPSWLIALLGRKGYAVDIIEFPKTPANNFD
ncbi:TraB/GumN family protein [Paraburkholderia sp. EG286B]|uniref:TraB/GumN family protein n=1 Tax=Paraburkholderia sp. EG286B TaxID=3237011 RepID=UPI0034D306C7